MHAMFAVRGDLQPGPRLQFAGGAIGKLDGSASLQHQHELVLRLVIPEIFRRSLPRRDDSFDPDRGILNQGFKDFLVVSAWGQVV